ncbi:MAG: cell division protein FtsA [Deferribacteres bacterium]|nr:cell division protein FtsA [Deferribacteres bacterium]
MNFGFIREVGVKDERIVVGLDVGTTKICAVVGEFSIEPDSGPVNVIGVGTAPSKGIRKGIITNIENMADSIREAVRQAESMAGVEIKAVHIGITGGHIECFSSSGVIAVREKEIGQKEVDSVIDAAKAVAIPFDREMLHVIPVGFTVNGQDGITDPRGMQGVRLETDVRIITGAATSVQNLIRSCRRAGLEVMEVIFQPLASAEAVLTEDEKELGVAVVDIGGGTTDIALFREGGICHSSVLAVGGGNFTNDIAIGLRMPAREAEDVKKKYGCTMISMAGEGEHIETGSDSGKPGRSMPRRYLVEILQPRAEELFTLIREEIQGFHSDMNSGVVLTGGAVLMEGMDVMAENILELPVRIGSPVGIESVTEEIHSPAYATGAGLALIGAEEYRMEYRPHSSRSFTSLRARMREWVGDVFKF